MSNPYFQFKKFTVWHDRCAMKVGTDGVLLGAWANVRDAYSALDVGTGTGLVALMLAQRNPNLNIHAIDCDCDASIQAFDNVQQSPFYDRIKCEQISFQQYLQDNDQTYDLIVSNPPFFRKSLKSPNQKRTDARHTDSLTPDELISFSSKVLSENGRLSLIYPFEYKEELILLGKSCRLCAVRLTNVFSTPSSCAKRVLIEFSKTDDASLVETDLVIEKERHCYSTDFIELLQTFYLKM